MAPLRLVEKNDATSAQIPFASIAESLNALLQSAEESAAVDAIDLALRFAADHRATDLHLEPWEECTALRFRIDGILHDIARLPRAQHARLVARIKILARMVTYQRDTPQDGRIDADAASCRRAVRVSTFPTVNGERVVLRIMEGADGLLDVDALGFDAGIVGQLRDIVGRPQGTLLLTGPSSSGKTTTIYALLREILSRRDPAPHVVTIEDPVERRLPGTAQTEIAPHHGFTFEAALRALLRQDPEVIMIGEIRDAETARAAIQAGLTGHLVISTIHSGSAAGVFTRLLDMGVEPYLAASSISGVLAQRLARKVCEACAEPYTPDSALVAAYGLGDFEGPFVRGAGCDVCQGIGYRGRIAFGELLLNSELLAERILDRSRTSVLNNVCVDAGMRPLADHGAELVRQRKTTIEELRRILPVNA